MKMTLWICIGKFLNMGNKVFEYIPQSFNIYPKTMLYIGVATLWYGYDRNMLIRRAQ